MSGFDESGKLAGGNEGNITRSPAPDDNGFLLIHHPVENTGQVFTETCICRFSRHPLPIRIVRCFCTAAAMPDP